MADPCDTLDSILDKIRCVVAEIDTLVTASKTSAHPQFFVDEVKKRPDDILRIHYEKSAFKSHLEAMVTLFKGLNDRIKTLGYLTHTMFEKYRCFMDGLPGQRGLESSLFDGERELRQTVAYIVYLDMVLAHANELR